MLEVLPTVSLSSSKNLFSENGGTDVVTATLNGVSNQDVVVSLAFSGAALQGVDYSASASSITIPAGQTSGSMTLKGLGNSHFGATPKSVVVSLASPTNAVLGSPASITATIELPTTTTFIQSVYEHLLGRAAGPDEVAYWNHVLTTLGDTTVGRAALVGQIEASTEYRRDEVDGLYEKYLHRSAAGDAGADFWAGQLAGAMTLEQVAAQIAASPEFVSKQTDGSFGSWLSAFYSNALSRGADAGATTYWSAVFAAGASRAQLAEAIFTALPQPGQAANEYRLKLVDSYYEQFLNRSAAGDQASNAWAALLQNGLRDETVIAAIMATQEFFNDSV